MCFCTPVSIPCLNYEAVVFKPKEVDIPDLGYMHPPNEFPSPPMLKIHTSDEIKRTKDRKLENLCSPVWSVGLPQRPRLYVLQLLFKPNKVHVTMTQDG